MHCTMDKDTAIRLLLSAHILDTVDSKYESRASVRLVNATGNSNGNVAHNTKIVSLRISKSCLIRLYNSTKEYFTREYISAIYTLGIGLPEDLDRAAFWKSRAIGSDAKCKGYTIYRRQLKSDIDNAITESYYVYDGTVNNQVSWLEYLKQKRNCEPCIIVYRSTAKGFKFHNFICANESMMFGLEPRAFGHKPSFDIESINCKNTNIIQYILRLGYLKKTEEYSSKKDILYHVLKIASDEYEAEAINKFVKSIEFELSKTLLVGYDDSITHAVTKRK